MPYYGTQDQSPTLPMDNSVPMADSATTVPTSHAAETVDAQILAVANSKTAVRFWDAGSFLNGSPNTGDMIVFSDSQTVAGGAGVAVFNITSDHTATGSALCSSIMLNSIKPVSVDSTANYNPGLPSVSSNKLLSVPYTKQGNTGVTLLSVGVLTAITYPATPNGTVITVVGWGISV